MTELARACSVRGELVLCAVPSRAGGPCVLELRVNGVHVMDTAETSSETALAELALAAAARPERVVVAGLGLGCTLRRVLTDPRVRTVRVIELEPALVGWLRADLVPGGRRLLADTRVEVDVADVRDRVATTSPRSVDVLLLDVDNGPDYLVHSGNAALYRPAFVRACAGVLVQRGVLAVWSMSRSARLHEALATAFGDVRAHRLPVRLQGRDLTYWVYVAVAPTTSLAA